jgi:hypothetical protein
MVQVLYKYITAHLRSQHWHPSRAGSGAGGSTAASCCRRWQTDSSQRPLPANSRRDKMPESALHGAERARPTGTWWRRGGSSAAGSTRVRPSQRRAVTGCPSRPTVAAAPARSHWTRQRARRAALSKSSGASRNAPGKPTSSVGLSRKAMRGLENAASAQPAAMAPRLRSAPCPIREPSDPEQRVGRPSERFCSLHNPSVGLCGSRCVGHRTALGEDGSMGAWENGSMGGWSMRVTGCTRRAYVVPISPAEALP